MFDHKKRSAGLEPQPCIKTEINKRLNTLNDSHIKRSRVALLKKNAINKNVDTTNSTIFCDNDAKSSYLTQKVVMQKERKALRLQKIDLYAKVYACFHLIHRFNLKNIEKQSKADRARSTEAKPAISHSAAQQSKDLARISQL